MRAILDANEGGVRTSLQAGRCSTLEGLHLPLAPIWALTGRLFFRRYEPDQVQRVRIKSISAYRLKPSGLADTPRSKALV
jgi:hypothetical protein